MEKSKESKLFCVNRALNTVAYYDDFGNGDMLIKIISAGGAEADIIIDSYEDGSAVTLLMDAYPEQNFVYAKKRGEIFDAAFKALLLNAVLKNDKQKGIKMANIVKLYKNFGKVYFI